MNCPACPDQALESVERAGMTLARCLACGGTWIPAAAFARLSSEAESASLRLRARKRRRAGEPKKEGQPHEDAGDWFEFARRLFE